MARDSRMSHDLKAVITRSEAEVSKELDALCRHFLAMARNKLSGTLVVESADEQFRSFLCHGGAIADLDTGREQTLLTEAILGTGQVNARALRKAEKTAEKPRSFHHLTPRGSTFFMPGTVNDPPPTRPATSACA